MYRVKIHGAGSVGNHLAHASRKMGWEVHLCDVDRAALERTRYQIYPQRYGAWDEAIQLFPSAEAPTGGYDFIFVGTPPASHLELAMAALKEKPKGLHVEKPLCPPDLSRTQAFYDQVKESGVHAFVGYDHVVARSVAQLEATLGAGAIGQALALDVEFREHWGGIFAAHPWLSGPTASYLAFWTQGGGASGEHSHALNLWQHLAHAVGAGRVVEVSALMDFVREGGADYDRLCALHLRTESGLGGRCVQDVITIPHRKWARVQGTQGWGEVHINAEPGADKVSVQSGKEGRVETLLPKTRPDDFITELQHMAAVIEGRTAASPIRIERGLDTMLVLVAAHRSAREGRTVHIDPAKGYGPEALTS
jgi:predicted dehydrogenase